MNNLFGRRVSDFVPIEEEDLNPTVTEDSQDNEITFEELFDLKEIQHSKKFIKKS